MSILITGGTGSFGQAYVRHLLLRTGVPRIVVYSRGEYAQHLMAEALRGDADRLRFMIGDVRDRDRLRRALDGIEVVVHAAALKRIEVGHYNPLEMVKTNIGGAVNLVEAAMDARCSKVVFLSSDKAFQPVSPYGLSKALAEHIFLNANNMAGTGPSFRVCRYGNVWRSTGSVVPNWEAAKAGGYDTVNVTDPECTRFFMRMGEAIALVEHAVASEDEGKIHIPHLPAYRLGDLATALRLKMNVTGLPAWEKKHESMAEGNCSADAQRMTVEELRSVLNET